MDPQTQQEFTSLREYLERQFDGVNRRLGKLEQSNAVRDAFSRTKGTLAVAAFPVALTALIAVAVSHF
jgi:hypothetical protein